MHLRFPLALSLAAVFALWSTAEAAKAKHHAKPHWHYEIQINGIAPAPFDALRSDWVQEGPKGLEARAVVAQAACPEISVDGHDWIMDQRAASDDKFAMLCSAIIPAGSKQAALVFRQRPTSPAGTAQLVQNLERALAEFHGDLRIVPLPLPPTDPQRIVVFGDTGCRIKGKELQASTIPTNGLLPPSRRKRPS